MRRVLVRVSVAALATAVALALVPVLLIQPADAAVCSATDTATLTTKLADATCDTINVAAGPYTGPFSITRSVILQGANSGISPNTGSRGAESAVTLVIPTLPNERPLTEMGYCLPL